MMPEEHMAAIIAQEAEEAKARAEAEERGEVEPMPAYRPRQVKAED